MPIIINDGVFSANQGNEGLDILFFERSNDGVPKYIFINKDLELHYKQSSYMSEFLVEGKIEEMLEEIEGN